MRGRLKRIISFLLVLSIMFSNFCISSLDVNAEENDSKIVWDIYI